MNDFKETVWRYYKANRREMPWRDEPYEQYYILVSEMMLQQTQVSRVISKYKSFLSDFPTAQSLAEAPLSQVLLAWSGLGYNRRAKYLHESAKQLHTKRVWNITDLVGCKGIGMNTAAAVIVYSYNAPLVFIETNIRTVYIYHFFTGKAHVEDKEIAPIVEATMDREHPREWYWALMDYGAHLKKSVGNVSRQSKHYAKQSQFEGSVRQLRGEVLRILATNPLKADELAKNNDDIRLTLVLESLVSDGLISHKKGRYSLAE